MEKNIKVLNLYAGIGGNRKLWEGIDCTAVEIEPKIAKIYQEFFPDDTMIIGDAHRYLLENFKEFDFIWSSPPCPTHSRMRFIIQQHEGTRYKFPDMKLYEEILFLQFWFNGKWVVENVISYYEPLIRPFKSGNHYFWSNFVITNKKMGSRLIRRNHKNVTKRNVDWGFNIETNNLNSKDKVFVQQIINNCVEPELALHVFDCAFKGKHTTVGDWV
jgi:DNA (cytosine-5)-methyltransferase 1